MAGEKVVAVIIRAIDRTRAAFDGAKKNSSDFADFVSSKIKQAFGALAIGSFFKGAIDEASQAQHTFNNIAGAVTNLGVNFETARPHIDAAVQSIKDLTGKDEDDISDALANLITKTGNLAGSLKNFTLVADIAAKENISLGEASDIVAKTMNGQIKAAKQLGITATTSAGAIAQMRMRYGGFAEGEGRTFSGTLGKIRESFKDVLQVIGEAIIGNGDLGDAVGIVIEYLKSATGWLKAHRKELGELVSGIVRFGVQVSNVFGPVIMWIGEKLGLAFRGAQMVVVEFTAEVEILGERFKYAVGGMLVDLGNFIEQGGILLSLFGINIEKGFGERLQNAGTKMQLEAARQMRFLRTAADETLAEIQAAQQESAALNAAETRRRAAGGAAGGDDGKAGKELDHRIDTLKALLSLETDRAAALRELVGIEQQQYEVSRDQNKSDEVRAAALKRLGELQGLTGGAGTPIAAPGPAGLLKSTEPMEIPITPIAEEHVSAFDRVRASIADSKDELENFSLTAAGAFEQYGQGATSAGGALRKGLTSAIADVARKKGKFFAMEGANELGHFFATGNPGFLAAAAKHELAAAGMFALAGASGGAGGGGGGGTSSRDAAERGADRLAQGGPVGTIIVRGGRYIDMTDPEQMESLRDGLQKMTGLRMINIEVEG